MFINFANCQKPNSKQTQNAKLGITNNKQQAAQDMQQQTSSAMKGPVLEQWVSKVTKFSTEYTGWYAKLITVQQFTNCTH